VEDLDYLRAAIAEAQDAEANGEVPVGAIVVHENKIIGRGQNRVLRDSDPTARLVYAAPDPKAGACGSVLSVMNHPQLNHKVEVTFGLLAEECGALLTNFFRARR
jgi:tRNA(Arg) A34 adenosine deaminase TadA